MKSGKAASNVHDSRESWLKAGTDLLRPHFAECGYDLPNKMRFAIAFPSTGRHGKRVGELWHADTSADGTYELFIRADLDDPQQVLDVLAHELVHAVLPIDAGHGPKYKEAALKLGLVGQMRTAAPGPLLRPKLIEIADALGPLPHAALAIERGRDNRGPVDRPKKQKARLLKAECADGECGYTVRITAKWVQDLGPPLCPKHGAMTVVGVPLAANTATPEENPLAGAAQL